MALMNEAAVGRLEPAQAAELLHLIDVEACWENLRKSATWSEPGSSLRDLQVKQKAYESFRDKSLAYRAKYAPGYSPDPLLSNPARLAAWCRAVRALCLRAAAAPLAPCPGHAVEKAYRAAERAGIRANGVLVRPPSPPANAAAAAEEMEALAQWCDGLAAVTQGALPPVPLRQTA